MRNILSKLDRNLRVCRDQMRAYIEELINIVFPDIADAARDFDIPEVLHKMTAIVEEFFDECPRIACYITLAYIIITLAKALL